MTPDESKDGMSRRDGLCPMGPLSAPLPALRVGFKPQSRLLQEKVRNCFLRLKEAGANIGPGTFASVRTMEGFSHFPDAKALMDSGWETGDRTFTVVDYDPTRRNFCIVGDGEGSVALEISWFCLRAFPDDMLVIGTPSEVGGGHPSESSELRLEHYLAMLRSWRSSRNIVSTGYRLLRWSDLKVGADLLV